MLRKTLKFALINSVFAIIISGCGNKDQNITAIAEKGNITEIGATNLSEHVKSLRIVPLETNDSLVIGRIDGIKVRDSNIYVLSNQRLYHFDSNGHYVDGINLVGTGPGEVNMVNDFDTDGNHLYIISPSKIVVRNFSDPTDILEITQFQSGGKIKKTDNGILASFYHPLPNGNGVLLFNESGDTIYSMLPVGENWGLPRTMDFVEYKAGEYIHQSMGNDMNVIVPANKQTYNISLIETNDALSTEDAERKISTAKTKFDVNGEIFMGLTPSESHLFWMGVNQGNMAVYIYNKTTSKTTKFVADKLIDDISGAPDIQQNMMLGMLAFNESDSNDFVSIIDPNNTYQYIKDNPNRFSDSYLSLDTIADDANPAIIFIEFL